MRQKARQRGFTLIELVMVIVIMGAISGIVAVFMRSPIDAYFDSARRAALTDVADTAVRRMARDIRKALPNSVRVPVTVPVNQCLEFIPTRAGGRYRTEELVPGDDTSLNFTAADATFNMLGSNIAMPIDQRIVPGDIVAVYNLGIPGANAYDQDNTATVVAAPSEAGAPIETTITISSTLTPASSNMLFPLASGGNRFHVIPNGENVVAFVCAGGNLRRTVRTFAGAACPATGAILAGNVGACNFVYNESDLQRNALVQLTVSFTDNNEVVNLYHEIHVDNTP